MEEMKVTSIDRIKEMSMGEVVPLPSFVEGEEFVARLRRPSLMALARDGKIPNALLGAANDVFFGKKDAVVSMDLLEAAELLHIMAEAALVEPTYEELTENGIELNDTQITAIFNYTQMGVKALESFRQVEGDLESDNAELPLSEAPQ